MNLREEVLARIDRDRDEIVSLCSSLVKNPSENPPGDTRQICRFISQFLESKGLPYQIHAPQEKMPNIVAHFKGKNPGRRLVFNGHMDVYPAGDPKRWKRSPFSGDVEEGKIFGRGSSDMKGGVTATLIAFSYLHQYRDRLNGEAVITLVSDEETGGRWGSAWLLENVPLVHGDAFFNGEPTSCELISFAEKGRVWLDVEAAGLGAHGAYTHIGDNAIQKMIYFLKDLEGVRDLKIDAPTDVAKVLEEGRSVVDKMKGKGATDVLMGITVNFGMISGGTKVNLVAESCRAEVDIRLPQGVPVQKMLQEIDRKISRYPGITYRILFESEPFFTPPDHEVFVRFRKNAEAIKGSPVFLSSGIGGTDAKHFRKYGMPCAIYGPRSHSMGGPDEYITVEDLILATKVHTVTALEYLGVEME
jgi:succinyl-diaminopimelate desuccinylase